jgi:hypothetical protein
MARLLSITDICTGCFYGKLQQADLSPPALINDAINY